MGIVRRGPVRTADQRPRLSETLTNLGDVTANVAEGVNVGSVGGSMNAGAVNGVNLGGTTGINMITTNTGVANVANSIAINAKVQ